MKTYRDIFTIVERWRLNLSIYGNPRIACMLKDSNGNLKRFQTASNASCGYSIENYELGSPLDIEYHITKTGTRIIDYINNHW